jgi:hypothetical protein
METKFFIEFLLDCAAPQERTKTEKQIVEHDVPPKPSPFHFYKGKYSISCRSARGTMATLRDQVAITC